jgi:hypothetical protein
MKFRRLNKKGQDVRTIGPVELVGHILGAAVVILIIIIAAAFATFYFGEKNKEFAINNFIALSNKIETLSKSREQFDVQRAFPFYLPSNFVVVGFNKGWDNNKISDGCEPEPVRKPSGIDGKEGKKCENSACICLFTNNDDFMDGDDYNVELVQCHPFPKADYIITLYLGTSVKDKDIGKDYKYPVEIYKNIVGERIYLPDYSLIGFSDYAFFYIYGQCEDHYWDENLQSKKLYVEKFTRNDRTFIFIAPEYEEASIIDERYNAMNKEYGESEKLS